MVNHNRARVMLMFLGLALFLVAMTLNTLSGFGAKSGVFQQRMEDITLKYTTPITPAQWTLFVWDFIYFWLFSMFIYFVVGLCRRTAYDWLYTLPAVLPYGFHASLIISICFNITWLFLFDRELLRAQLIISALMTFANYTILFFSCHGLKIYAAWLHKYHNMDLWLIRILVQNGVAVYATWGTVSTLLNLTIYLQHQRGTSRCDCAMLSLMLLLMELFAWFLLENFYLDEHVRYIVTIYPVVILWLSGVLDNSTSPKSPMYIFAALILAISCIMFAARIALITWRHRKHPLYKDSGLSMSPKSCVGAVVRCSHNIVERSKMFLLSLTNTEHVVIHAWSIALAVITQVTSDIFYILAKDSNLPNALFQTSLRNMTETFPLEVTMDWWSEIYWVMIDFWSKTWLTEAVVGLLTRNVLGPQSCNPEIHPPVFYLTWTIICVVRMCHDPLWGCHAVFAAVFFRWMLPVLGFYMLYMSTSNLDKHKAWLAINNPRQIFWIRLLTQNGLAAFAWWSLLDAIEGFGIVLKYKAGVTDPLVSSIVLTIITMCIITWFILENFLLTEYLRYTFSVYPFLILGLASIFTRSYKVNDFSANTVFCGFILLLMTLMSVIHLIAACLNTNKQRNPPAEEPHWKGEGCATVCQPEGKTAQTMHD